MFIIINFLYLLSVAFWVGSIFFFSFFAAPSIFKILPKNSAGDVVADIFPKYYLITYICGVLIILTVGIKKYYFESAERFINLTLILVILMLGISLYAGHVLRPQAAEVKKEIRNMERTDSPEYIKLRRKFSLIHIKSLVSNIFVFIIGIAIVLITAYNYRVG